MAESDDHAESPAGLHATGRFLGRLCRLWRQMYGSDPSPDEMSVIMSAID